MMNTIIQPEQNSRYAIHDMPVHLKEYGQLLITLTHKDITPDDALLHAQPHLTDTTGHIVIDQLYRTGNSTTRFLRRYVLNGQPITQAAPLRIEYSSSRKIHPLRDFCNQILRRQGADHLQNSNLSAYAQYLLLTQQSF